MYLAWEVMLYTLYHTAFKTLDLPVDTQRLIYS